MFNNSKFISRYLYFMWFFQIDMQVLCEQSENIHLCSDILRSAKFYIILIRAFLYRNIICVVYDQRQEYYAVAIFYLLMRARS